MLKGDVLGAYELQRKALRIATEMGLPFFEVLCRVGLAQILVECGDENKAVNHLRELRRIAKQIDNALLEFMSLLTYAHIALSHGRVNSGLKALAYAFRVGRERGYMHCVWWQPRIMAGLAATALRNDIEPEYAKRLIRARNLVPDEPPLISSPGPGLIGSRRWAASTLPGATTLRRTARHGDDRWSC